MTGRAGRQGIDEEGESILFCKPSERTKVESLFKSVPKPVKSCLNFPSRVSKDLSGGEGRDPLNRAVLEFVANSATSMYDDIVLYLSCTLLCAELVNGEKKENKQEIREQIILHLNESLEYLINQELVEKREEKLSSSSDKSEGIYYVTQLGMATVASSLTPSEALIVFEEFSKARRSLILENELHMIYLVTPVSLVNQWPSIDWYKFLCIWEQLLEDMKCVGTLVGVQEGFIVRALQGKPPDRTKTQRERLLAHRRFYACLALHDLVKETALDAVSRKFGVSKGFLQSLQSAAGTFAGMVTVFCNRLSWKNMEVLLCQFQSRLVFGVERELVDLVKISLLNGARARALYNAGYHTLAAVASANPTSIESTLRKAFPFESKKHEDGSHRLAVHWCTKLRKGMCEFEAASLIIEEARQILSEQLNVPVEAVIWGESEKGNVDTREVAGVATPTSESLRNYRKVLNSQDVKKPDILSKKLKLEQESNSLVAAANKSTVPVSNNSSLDLFSENQLNDNWNTKDVCSPQIFNSFSTSFNVQSRVTFKDLSSEHSSICSGLTIVDLSTNPALLEGFLKECTKQDHLAFSVATETISKRSCIGGSLIKNVHSLKGLPLGNEQVVGVAFNWGNSTEVYYLSLCDDNQRLSSEKPVTTLPLSHRIEALCKLFSDGHTYKLVALDFKKQIKCLLSTCHMQVTGLSCDPYVADWLLDPDSNEKTISQLINVHLTQQLLPGQSNVSLSSLAVHSPLSNVQAAAESILAGTIMVAIEMRLTAEGLMGPFASTEMPSVGVLAKLEMNGIGFCKETCCELQEQLQLYLSELEREAFKLAGRSFSISSPEDVGRVLFQELGLRPSRETKQIPNKDGLRHLKTSKEILEKLSSDHPLPELIMEWRRVTNTINRTLNPLLKSPVTFHWSSHLRVHCTCQFHTATGRVSLSDPCLQNVPKEYCIKVCKRTHNSQRPAIPLPTVDQATEKAIICMRDIFTSFPGGVFVSADYAQLELRILAHLSQDDKLCAFLNEDGDAFRKIAREWLSIEGRGNVTDEQRQLTKQLCYGVIYGIGTKSLGEQLNVTENEAAQFMEAFKSKYTGVSSYMARTVQQCQEKGYVMTFSGRKRFLPAIRSANMAERAQAERQAVNSTVQGSASDIAKRAMINIDCALTKSGLVTYLSQDSHNVDSSRLALLVLQLHDELMYEVHETRLAEVASIVQYHMETAAVELSVKLPVRLKVGKSWGQLKSYEI